MTKICSRCKIEKEVGEYYVRSQSKDGLNAACKSCINLYNTSNRDKNILRCKRWHQAHRSYSQESHRKWRADNSQQEAEAQKEWYRLNKAKVATNKRNKYNSDPLFRLANLLRMRLNDAIKGRSKNGSAVRSLGCLIPELKLYLESRFQPGMTWDNHGKHGWHIDHIVPLSFFDLADPEQLKKACHYTNLRPLWAEDNLRKGNQIEST